ncbi:Spermatogenesis-associated protein 20 [Gryllus bimaculatus]|nr:Spermatogenesis-associated protein 20 [Gryllus bimaculatus]
MSVWLTPDLLPVYGGTYYPPEDHESGMPGFRTLLKVLQTQVPPECAERCLRAFAHEFEAEFGGFGYAPKFPQAPVLDFLLHEYARAPASDAGRRALAML